jgi:hypothetical protein
VLPTWHQALDAIGHDDEPWHVARFDAQGVLSGSKDANRCIGYLTKYLTKEVADCQGEWIDPRRGQVPSSVVAGDWLGWRGSVKRRTRETDEAPRRNCSAWRLTGSTLPSVGY